MGAPVDYTAAHVYDLAYSPQLRQALGLRMARGSLKLASVYQLLTGNVLQELTEVLFYLDGTFFRTIMLLNGELSDNIEAQTRNHGAVSVTLRDL